MSLELLIEGRRAAEEILHKVYRLEVRKSLNPLHLPDFEKISRSLAHDLKGQVLPVEDKALKKAMNALDAKWTEIKPEGRKKLLDVATGYVGKPVVDVVLPKIEQTLKYAAKDIVPATKKNAILAYDLKISPNLDATDDKILHFTVASQGHYVTDRYANRVATLSDRAKEIVSDGLSKGLGSADISQELMSELSMHAGRGRGYWDMLAMVFSNRARNMTQLSAFRDAGIRTYVWESVLDEVTSTQCRFMHGREFSVGSTMMRFDQVENADDPEAIKTLQPFMSVGKNHLNGEPSIFYTGADGSRQYAARITESALGQKDKVGSYDKAHSNEDLAAAGITCPPIHGRCFPGHVVVEGAFTGGFRALYVGELLEIETVGGRRLVTTPHHEILTSKGGILAKLLAEGDELACYTGRVDVGVEAAAKASTVRQDHEDHGPTCIEEAFRLLAHARPPRAIDRASFDLNGDEVAFDGDVQIVGAEGKLLHRRDSAALESVGDVGLEKSDVAESGLVRLDFGADSGARLNSSSRSGPCARALALDARPVNLELRPLEPLRIGTASQINVGREEPPDDGRRSDIEIGGDSVRRVAGEIAANDRGVVERNTRARLSFPVPSHSDAGFAKSSPEYFVADARFFTEVFDRFSGLVAKDQVRQVRNLGSSTLHVFDLQTDRGWFVANGILVSNCRSTIIPVDEVGGGGPLPAAPPEPVEAPPKLTSGQAKAKALDALSDAVSLADNPGKFHLSDVMEQMGETLPPFLDHPFFNGDFAASGWGDGWALNAKSKKPSLDALIPTAVSGNAEKVKGFILKPKALDAAAAPRVVQLNGKLYIVSGHDELAAQKLLGQKVAYCDVVNLDKPLKKVPLVHPVEPPPAESALGHVIHPIEPATPPVPPPLAPVLAPSPPPEKLPANVILGQKTGEAGGSNEGGFYTGTDGVKRYVKFYKDPGQAEQENLANQIYRDLGHVSPTSHVFEHEGRTAYASDILPGVRTLGDAGLTEERAKEAMKGFVADVLVGNWDATGMSLDNMVVTADGRIARIDNGGSFLMRAKAGRKPDAVLNVITEWDKFFESGTNPAYSKVAAKAGVYSANDMKDLVLAEIKKVRSLVDANGGWKAYVNRIAPGLPEKDWGKVVDMLEARTKLLEVKAAELSRPVPSFVKPTLGEGEVNVVGFRSSHAGGSRLRSKVQDRVVKDFVKPIYEQAKIPKLSQAYAEQTINDWTGEYKEGSRHRQMYGAAQSLIAGSKKERDDYTRALAPIYETRQARWRAMLDSSGMKDVPTPTHFDLTRGAGKEAGMEFLTDLVRAWKDDTTADATFKSYELASWTISDSLDKPEDFAGSTGWIARWKCPMENTMLDQVVDDQSFLSGFMREHEVIAGNGTRKGIPLPKEEQIARFNGTNYTYSEREKLFAALKRAGHSI